VHAPDWPQIGLEVNQRALALWLHQEKWPPLPVGENTNGSQLTKGSGRNR
jgi:hypothetical protein